VLLRKPSRASPRSPEGEHAAGLPQARRLPGSPNGEGRLLLGKRDPD
jgi:hypothetical protein